MIKGLKQWQAGDKLLARDLNENFKKALFSPFFTRPTDPVSKKFYMEAGYIGDSENSSVNYFSGGESPEVDLSEEKFENWDTSLQNHPTNIRYHGQAGYDGKVWICGGESNTNKLRNYNPETDTWTLKANMPVSKDFGLGFVEADGKLYAFGGYQSENLTYEYDPSGNSWTQKANMPANRTHMGDASYNGKVYSIAGSSDPTSSGNTTTGVYEYDPNSDSWTTLSSYPAGAENLASVAYNGKIYSGGGNDSVNNQLNNFYEYDIAGDTWTALSNLPYTAQEHAIGQMEGAIFLMGGYNGSSRTSDVDQYDIAGNSWSNIQSMPSARQYIQASTTNNHIYIVGGYDGSPNNNNWKLSVNNSWKMMKNMPTPRRYLSGAESSNKFYLIGGHDGNSVSDVVEEYDPSGDTYTTKATMTTAREKLACIEDSGNIYAVGGHNGTSEVAAVEKYDVSGNTWSSLASMPTARSGIAIGINNGKIYVAGGYDGTNRLNTLEVYDISGDTWSSNDADMNHNREGCAGKFIDGGLYIFGGYNGTSYLDIVEQYDISSDTWTAKANMNNKAAWLDVEIDSNDTSTAHIVGGKNSGGLLNNHEAYSPIANEYKVLGSITNARYGLALLEYNSEIYAIGGEYGVSATSGLNERYISYKRTGTVRYQDFPSPHVEIDWETKSVNPSVPNQLESSAVNSAIVFARQEINKATYFNDGINSYILQDARPVFFD